jgi:hypothetical protein
VRKLTALIVATGLVASLAACSSEPTADDCSTRPASGPASQVITADGQYGSQTSVDFPTPLVADEIQVTELTRGDGDILEEGEYADFQATIWNAANGDYVTGTSFDLDSPSRTLVGGPLLVGPLVECAAVGSRIAAVSTLEQLFGDIDASADGLSADSNLVVVIDITDSTMGKADGDPQLAKPGMPSVVTAPNGTPGITIPAEEPPTELSAAVLKQGDGATVEEGDKAIMHFSGFVWGEPGTVFASSWEQAVPSTFLATEYSADGSGGLFPGTADAIIGQQVGSQVIVIVPPEESYPEGTQAPDAVPAGSTRVYVIDILDVQK